MPSWVATSATGLGAGRLRLPGRAGWVTAASTWWRALQARRLGTAKPAVPAKTIRTSWRVSDWITCPRLAAAGAQAGVQMTAAVTRPAVVAAGDPWPDA